MNAVRRTLLVFVASLALGALGSCTTSSLTVDPCLDFCYDLADCQQDSSTVDCGDSCSDDGFAEFENVFCCTEYEDCTLFMRCVAKTDGSNCNGVLNSSGSLDGDLDPGLTDEDGDEDLEDPERPYTCRQSVSDQCDYKEGICENFMNAAGLSQADVAPCCQDVDCGCNSLGACTEAPCVEDGFADSWCPDDPDLGR